MSYPLKPHFISTSLLSPSIGIPPAPPPFRSQVRVTGGLQQYLPSFLPGLLGMGGVAALERLVYDAERHILYSLAANSAIQVSRFCGIGHKSMLHKWTLSQIARSVPSAKTSV